MTHHLACQKQMSGTPSRLLDLRDFEHGKILLVDTASFQSPLPDYFTLSHCWGKRQLLQTTMETLLEHQKGISISDLPRTFVDAVKITRRLRTKFLWIDSLCIVQDSKEDWEREAQAMASIYWNSALTISATSSSDGQGGCYLERNTGTLETISQMTPNGFKYSVKIRDRLVRSNITKPLLGRGWVLQETILSRRVLHFTSDQIFWQCKECFLSEDGSISDGRKGRIGLLPQGLGFITDINISEKEPQDRVSMWHSWIEDYSGRNFTYEKDRLPALAGLVQYYQMGTKDIPLVGLWASSLHLDLAWVVGDPENTHVNRVMGLPSWSWLSVRGLIDYSSTDDIDDIDNCFELKSPLHLIDYNLEWSGLQHVSQLISSKLVVSSKLFRLATGGGQCENGFTLVDHITFIPDDLFTTFDTSNDFGQDIEITCLVLFHHSGKLNFLLLRPMSESNVYKRIGLGTLDIGEEGLFNSFLDNLEVRHIGLV